MSKLHNQTTQFLFFYPSSSPSFEEQDEKILLQSPWSIPSSLPFLPLGSLMVTVAWARGLIVAVFPSIQTNYFFSLTAQASLSSRPARALRWWHGGPIRFDLFLSIFWLNWLWVCCGFFYGCSNRCWFVIFCGFVVDCGCFGWWVVILGCGFGVADWFAGGYGGCGEFVVEDVGSLWWPGVEGGLLIYFILFFYSGLKK